MSGLPVYSLLDTTAETLFEAFNAAFADYERSWTREEFERMLQRRGFDPALSFGAFDNNKLVSFTLNGSGLYDHKKQHL